MSNQKCKTRPQIVNVNGDVPLFFPYSIKISKCSGTCNNIKNPLAKLCVRDVVKNLNVNDTFTIPFPFCAKNFLVLFYYISSLFGFLYFLVFHLHNIVNGYGFYQLLFDFILVKVLCLLAVSSLLRCFVFTAKNKKLMHFKISLTNKIKKLKHLLQTKCNSVEHKTRPSLHNQGL